MKTILLVDGEQAHAECIATVLRSFGYAVITKQDAQSALSVLHEGPETDLVITDYAIAGMDGLEFLAAIKKLAPLMPTIILTAHDSIETYLKALSLGAVEYLNKPVHPADLGRVIRTALQMHEPVATVCSM
ncbi:MAG: response regulator [Nitrospirota bacterium]